MSKSKPKINLEEWTPERFKEELIDAATGRLKPFTEENKAALYSLTREQAIQLDPKIFARWKIGVDPNFNRKGGKTRGKQVRELKDWSVKIRKLLEDRELTATMLNQKRLPKWLNPLIGEDGEMPTPSEVIGATLMAKAMAGDVRATEELRKMGFGDKVTIDAGESFFNKEAIKLEIVHPTQEAKEMERKEFGSVIEKETIAPVTTQEVQTVTPATQMNMPSASDIDGPEIPLALQQEFDRQEQERQNTPIQRTSGVNDHGIDRSILDHMVITRNKKR